MSRFSVDSWKDGKHNKALLKHYCDEHQMPSITVKKSNPEQHILAARNIRKRLNRFKVSDEDLKRAKEDGRTK